ncbi:MAG: hypothetical protein H2069_10240 [Legionella sp.]|nr:hypothetical protein [Legionella sp.]
MQQQNEPHSPTETLDIVEHKKALTKFMSVKKLNDQDTSDFFKALKFKVADSMNQGIKNGIALAMYERLKKANAKDSTIKISIMGFIKYAFPFLFTPMDETSVQILENFITRFLRGCPKNIHSLLVRARRKPGEVINEVLDEMNLSREYGADPVRFAEAILENAPAACVKTKCSFHEFLVYCLYAPEKENGIKPTEDEWEKADRQARNTAQVLKRAFKNTPAHDMLFVDFWKKVAAFQLALKKAKENSQEAHTKHRHLSTGTCQISFVSSENNTVADFKPALESTSVVREPFNSNRLMPFYFWAEHQPIQQPSKAFENAHLLSPNTRTLFEEASFLNDMNVEDFLGTIQSQSSLFEQHQLAMGFATAQPDRRFDEEENEFLKLFGN